MWGALASVGSALLSTAGQLFTNKESKAEAQRNRDFQAMMSSTAAQRSVADYKAAGLNPALAYERTASTPGGAQANIGNPIEMGLSSARQTAQVKQAMQIAKQQNEADLENKRASTNLANATAHKATQEAGLATQTWRNAADLGAQIRQQTEFARAAQPYMLRQNAATALLQELQIPGAQNTAKWETTLGQAGKGITTARTLSEIIKMLNPRDFRR